KHYVVLRSGPTYDLEPLRASEPLDPFEVRFGRYLPGCELFRARTRWTGQRQAGVNTGEGARARPARGAAGSRTPVRVRSSCSAGRPRRTASAGCSGMLWPMGTCGLDM